LSDDLADLRRNVALVGKTNGIMDDDGVIDCQIPDRCWTAGKVCIGIFNVTPTANCANNGSRRIKHPMPGVLLEGMDMLMDRIYDRELLVIEDQDILWRGLFGRPAAIGDLGLRKL